MSDLDHDLSDIEPALTLVDVRRGRAPQAQPSTLSTRHTRTGQPWPTSDGYPAAFLAELIAQLRARPAWQRDALCHEYPNVDFFPGRGASAALRAAKDICSRCLVARECAAYAVEHGIEQGVWGGLSGRQRRDVRLGHPARIPAELPTHCKRGHEYTAANCEYSGGQRRCITCRHLRQQAKERAA